MLHLKMKVLFNQFSKIVSSVVILQGIPKNVFDGNKSIPWKTSVLIIISSAIPDIEQDDTHTHKDNDNIVHIMVYRISSSNPDSYS